MEHVLQLYQEEHCLLDALAEFAAAGLREDEGILMVGSTPRWELLLERLRKAGVAVASHMTRGQLRLLGAHVVLTTCATRGVADHAKFNEIVGGAVKLARTRFERVRVFSELTDALWREGDAPKFFSMPEPAHPVQAHEWPAMALTDGKVIDILARGAKSFAIVRIPTGS